MNEQAHGSVIASDTALVCPMELKDEGLEA